jgi:hypothetical protein
MAIYELSKRIIDQRRALFETRAEKANAESELSKLLAENPSLITRANVLENDLITIRDSLLKKKGFQSYSINNYWDKSKVGEFLKTCQLLDMPSVDEKWNYYESLAKTSQREAIKLITRGSLAYKLGKDVALITKSNFATTMLLGAVPILAIDALGSYLGCCNPDSSVEIANILGVTNLVTVPLFTVMSYAGLHRSEVDNPLTYIAKEIKERAGIISEYAN